MRRFLIILAIILIFITAIITIAPKLFDVNNYKNLIIEKVKEQTGKDISINDKISLRLLPDISVIIPQLKISANGQELIVVKKIIANLKLIPLLSGKIEIANAEIISPDVKITKFKNGQLNLVQKTEQPLNVNKKPVNVLQDQNTIDYYLAKYSLNELIVKDGNVVYFDEKTNKKLYFKDFNLKTSLTKDKNPIKMGVKIFADNKILGVIETKANYKISDKLFLIDDINLKFDNFTLNGKIDANFQEKIPNIAVSLKADDLDLDKFLKVSENKPDNAATKTNLDKNDKKQFSWSTDPIRIDLPKKQNFNFNFSARTLTYNKIIAKNIDILAYLKQGQLNIKLNNIGVFDGTIKGEAMLDNTNKGNKYFTKLNINNVNLGLAPPHLGFLSKVKSILTGDLNLNSIGLSQKDIISHLQGTVNFNSNAGYIEGFDLLSIGQNTNKEISTLNNSEKTNFNKFMAQFDIMSGIVTNKSVYFETNSATLDVTGNINLPLLSIDYKAIGRQNISSNLSQKFNFNIPIKIYGSLLNPSFQADIAGGIKSLINSPYGKKKIGDNLQKILEGF